jgi:hypothetical protein
MVTIGMIELMREREREREREDTHISGVWG